ncbi:MAG: carbon-nitrogen hydrolase family protein [Verrucomicrobia bacterium]|nr:carbon-nitrogen hydrolase family protein [Verrucomicrobiota bacterium]MDA1087311.1 carbon-nitrogen hydrolase family protein [Verrucomicrobiota bacterium]
MENRYLPGLEQSSPQAPAPGISALTCSVIQMSAGKSWRRNLGKALGLIEACKGSDIIVLPEMFVLRASDPEQTEQAETIPGPTTDALAQKARELECWLVAGSIVERVDARRFNSCVVFDRRGRIAGHYRKIHLFDVDIKGERTIRESNTFSSGSEPMMVNIEGWRCGLAICYDLRFPELFRYYADVGAHLVFIPSNFTDATGRAHWMTLLRARAIENQCYVAAPNQYGKHPHLKVLSHGHSAIIDPWGEILGEAKYSERIVTAELDPARLATVRQSIPALKHRVL